MSNLQWMRFRVRPPKNREKNLTVKALMKIAGSKVYFFLLFTFFTFDTVMSIISWYCCKR